MFCAAILAMCSLMWPVFGTPVGTGVGLGGAIATLTPAAKTSGWSGWRYSSVTGMKPAGLPSPGVEVTASTPVNGGTIIANANGSTSPSASWISPSRTSSIDAFAIPRMPSRSKNFVTRFCGVADAAEAEVAEERLRRDERDRHAVCEAGLAELVAGVEQELVGRAEARAALRGADDDRAGVLQEALPGVAREDRVVEVADRLRVAALGAESSDLLEREARAGRDHEPVVGELPIAGDHDPSLQVEAVGGRVHERDPLALEHRRELERDIGGAALAERQPDQRGDEREVIAAIEDGHLDRVLHPSLDLERGRQAGEARADDDHPVPPAGTVGNAHLYPR